MEGGGRVGVGLMWWGLSPRGLLMPCCDDGGGGGGGG